ncbi:MAG: DNA translocase FtsK 4TM domain-containing protein [Pseudomonadota bacterium]|nr:DNA translocase FtsK 4TM domain-containing protein [Pseudomonadota bacterium]
MAGHLREGAAVLFAALAIYLLMSLLSFNPQDPGWSHTGVSRSVTNLGGVAGAWFADVSFFLLGYLAYLAPVMVALSGWLVVRRQSESGGVDFRVLALRWAGFFVTVAAGCGLATLHFASGGLPMGAGGLLGELGGEGLVPAFSFVGTTLLLLAFFLAGVTLFTGLSWLRLADLAGGWIMALGRLSVEAMRGMKERHAGRQARGERKAAVKAEKARTRKRKPRRIEPKLSEEEKPSSRQRVEQQIPLFDAPGDTELPPLSLLDSPRESAGGYSDAALEAMSRLVELKLLDFGIEVEVVEVHPGPVITRFEIQPAAGVKASRISNLSKDLARSLSITSVRVVEVIPGKSVVGLEIPNENREIVTLREILDTARYGDSRSPLTLALGKDIAGRPVVADLARMPHLLVAGTTGSGKSVAINAMLLSLLYKATPEHIRLILIDPKMLELSVYEGVPQLLTPVVTDMKEAANALRWSVAEMERRYKLMSVLGVRNITGYNKKVNQAAAAGQPIPDPLYNPVEALDPEAPPPELGTLPLIVIVVDEFADMMMVVGKKVEELIARLAQKARAAGIHLVLATQRPSVDVITGLIKANIPTRIAFQVSSRVDSRTILDQMGAEQLLGHGDMLYLPPGTALPERVHGAFVDDHEVHRVVNFLKGLGEPDYVDEVLQEPPLGGGDGIPGLEPVDGAEEGDPLYDQAVAIVTETRKASISYVQRRLKVGYNRAARMIEDMELAGVVSPVQANGGREVLAPPPVGN